MGEVFAGRYELLDPIAMGGMGTVWCVLDRSDNQVKAAKILRQSDASSLLRFVREQSMRIDHRHVVTPQSWAGMDDRVLFTMPLVRGGSVAGLLKEHGALPVRWTALLVDQTLQALEAVHAAGIVHRDVKPANLLLEPTGAGRPHLRLTDFGIAAPLDEPRMTRASMVIGSPGYMAPEQWRGSDPDFRSDLYSVGRVGLEMLTGVRPTSDSPVSDFPVSGSPLSGSPASGTDALHTDDPARNALTDLLVRATDEDPRRRPESAAQLRSELASLQLETLPPEPGERIVIRDEFASLELPALPASAPAPAPSNHPATAAATRVEHGAATRVQTAPSTHPARPSGPSRLPAFLLLLVGVLSLLGAGYLLLA
ncbi:serine/threonine protein kinase [Nocardioides sp. JQ2195]|uniref:serine/threonine-protein kinase n=1 Tax=Nocardioides sp. JQ2195 TaxID=2592334 RepID=UPI00143E5537|nr:serine/threonine-protein kinase [Nocardioides sp. JQ2195]QIX27399.1 serine/threonine protein kinase [Nocardioides sp. JQ2195]